LRPEVEFYVQGQRFLVHSDEPRDHILKVARIVDGQLSEATGGRHAASFPHAVLVCMSLASDLLRLRDELAALREGVATTGERLLGRIDDGLRELAGDG